MRRSLCETGGVDSLEIGGEASRSVVRGAKWLTAYVEP